MADVELPRESFKAKEVGDDSAAAMTEMKTLICKTCLYIRHFYVRLYFTTKTFGPWIVGLSI